MLRRDEVQRCAAFFSEASRLIVLCHANPDGDAAGALLGMGMLLEQAYPHTAILFLCKDPLPEMLSFLPQCGRIVHEVTPEQGDIAVILDCAEPKLTQFHEIHPHLFDRSMHVVNIDHHPTNLNFGEVNLVNPAASSACEIVTEFADMLGWTITPDIATCLLTGVYTDTGGLL